MSSVNGSLNSEPQVRIAIIGRPNVGKSTLFNRLFGRRRALVNDFSGVTRDRLIEKKIWDVKGEKYRVELMDTGGIGGETLGDLIDHQAQLAFRAADVILFVFDGKQGLQEGDRDIYSQLCQSGIIGKKPVIGVVNKADPDVVEDLSLEFYELGLESTLAISAEHNRGVELLKEEVVEMAKLNPGEIEGFETSDRLQAYPKIAVVGKPNVGKSTLANALLGQDRMITSDMAGTTVDAIDMPIEVDGRQYCLIDTAGVRRKSKTEKGVEVLSVLQTKKALERADLALFLIDADLGVTDQDEKIGGLIEDAGCSVIILINKWDLMAKREGFGHSEAIQHVHSKMAYLRYAPIMFTSAIRKTGLKDLGSLIQDVLAQQKTRISDKELTDLAHRALDIQNPKRAKIYWMHQTATRPPSMVCHVNDPKKVHFSVRRHIINTIRDQYGFMGSPVRLILKTRSSRP